MKIINLSKLDTCPLTKINAVYNNKQFDKNHVNLLIALITAVDNQSNEGYLGRELWMEKTRLGKNALTAAKKQLVEMGVIEELEIGNSFSNRVNKYKLHVSKLITSTETEEVSEVVEVIESINPLLQELVLLSSEEDEVNDMVIDDMSLDLIGDVIYLDNYRITDTDINNIQESQEIEIEIELDNQKPVIIVNNQAAVNRRIQRMIDSGLDPDSVIFKIA